MSEKPTNISFRTRFIDYDEYLKVLGGLRKQFPTESVMELRARIFKAGMQVLKGK